MYVAQDLFSPFGAIKKSGIVWDKAHRSTGVAKVTFASKASAVQAIQKYNGVPLDKRPMFISFTDASSKVGAVTLSAVGGGGRGRGIVGGRGVSGGRGAGRGAQLVMGGGRGGGRGLGKKAAPAPAAGRGGRGRGAAGRGAARGRGGRGRGAGRGGRGDGDGKYVFTLS